MPKHHLQGITDSVKLAREHALLGNYSVSLATYDGITDQIDSYLSEAILSMDLKTQWSQLKQRLRQEYQIIQNIQNELNIFSNGFSSSGGNSSSSSNNNSNSNNNGGGGSRMKPLPKFFEDPSEKSAGGGVAFVVNTVANNSPTTYDDQPLPRAKTPNQLGGGAPPQDNYDPDVWLPPTPVQGVSKPKRLSNDKKVLNQPPTKQVNNRVSINAHLCHKNIRSQIMSIRS